VRLVVLGVDASGRSCVVQQSELPFAPIPGLPGSKHAKLFATDQSPPPPRPPGLGKCNADSLPPGYVTWYAIEHGAVESEAQRRPTPTLHHRNAIDMTIILEGGGDMLLGDGPFSVQAGDCIVMHGIDHALHPGVQGCRQLLFAIGTPPP
jgi:mannose-6-phosphate isomerase-like protein (cupin superfamily)